MKRYIYSFLLFLLVNTFGFSQTKSSIELIGDNTVIRTGAYTNNSANITLPKGKNRVLIVTYWIERYHSTFNNNVPYAFSLDSNNNIIVPYFTSTISPSVNSQTNLKPLSNAMFGAKDGTNTTLLNALELSVHHQSSFMFIGSSDVDQSVTLNFGIPNLPKTANDELVMSYTVYSNVSSLSDNGTDNSDLRPRIGFSKGGSDNAPTSYAATHNVVMPTPTVPSGRTANEIVFTGFVGSSKTNPPNFGITGNPSMIHNINVTNGSGNNGLGAMSGNQGLLSEHDGVSIRRFDFNRGGVNPSPTSFNVTKEANVYYTGLRAHVATLLPLAMPSYSGRVFVDNNASTIGGSTGKPAADYVYVIGKSGKVEARISVNSDGTFIIPAGVIEEAGEYTLQLSNQLANVGDSKPASTLKTGYGYSRESLTNTVGKIESPGNGELLITDAPVVGINTIAFSVVSISAVNDSYTATAAQGVSGTTFTTSVLANDTFNGSAATLSTVNITNVVNPTSAGTPVPTLSPSTGLVTVPPGTPAGVYEITYSICDKSDGIPCSNTATVTVTVPSTTIIADDDNFSSTPISSLLGGTTTSVFANDNYNGGSEGSVNSTNSTLSKVGNWPNDFTLNTDGTISIAAGTAPGNYELYYKICDKINPTVCDDAKVTIVVESGYCFEAPIVDNSKKVNANHGITSLGRAHTDGTNWPSVRQSAWTVLEAKTKGFVVNRVAFNASGLPVGIAPSNFVEGMMVYDTTNNCLKIYNGTVWSCFSTPACP